MCRKNTTEEAEAAKQRDRVRSRERMRRLRAANPEREKELKRAYYLRHQERLQREQREWSSANRESVNAAARERHQRIKAAANAARRACYFRRDEARLARERRAADPVAYRAAQRAYRAENRAKVAAWDSTKRAVRCGAEGRHTAADVHDHYASQEGCCYWCDVSVGDVYHVDHVIPLARGGTDWPDNIVVACPSCNVHKHAKMPEEWAQWLLEHKGISPPHFMHSVSP